MINTKLIIRGAAGLLSLLATLNTQLSTCYAQGALTPPGAPAPTMKTLSQIEPRTPIATAPFTITNSGSYYLTTNVTVSSGNAITVSANNVTLDLNGFTISSTENPAVAGDGIYLGAVTNIAIYNGHISSGVTNSAGAYGGSGFGSGIFGGGFPYNVRVSDLSVSGCEYDGIYLGYNCTMVKSCVVNTVGAYGILAQSVSDSTANNCGITAISATTAADCYGASSGSGMGLSADTAGNCKGTSTSGGGVNATAANNCYGYSFGSGTGLSATTANNCTGSSATGDGLDATTANGSYGYTSGSGYGVHAYNIATGCYGQSGSGSGLYAQTADNCYGQSSSGTGLQATTANCCFGLSTSGLGLFASGANNCLGTSTSGTGFNAIAANNCLGSSSGTNSIALNASIAIGCVGANGNGGAGMSATIANSCFIPVGTTNIVHKYNMP